MRRLWAECCNPSRKGGLRLRLHEGKACWAERKFVNASSESTQDTSPYNISDTSEHLPSHTHLLCEVTSSYHPL